MMKKLGLTTAALVVLGALAPLAPSQTITAIVAESGGEFDGDLNDYDLLLTAVLAVEPTTGLATTLDDPTGDFTIFAPNDRAFVRTARDLGYTGWDEGAAWDFLVGQLTILGGGDPIGPLTQILLYHGVGESLSPLQIFLLSIFSPSITTLQGETITPFFFRLIDNEPGVPNPRIRWPFNIQADNGVIHTVNRVLLPNILP